MKEFSWIETYLAPLAGEGSLGLKDDAALLSIPEGQQLVITTDTLNESIHFKVNSDSARLAQKALRVNLSDLAAKGAKPIGYTLNLSLPEGCDESFIATFCEGLKKDQTQFDITLLGGDTTRSNDLFSITITAYGITDKPLLRSGAKIGDTVYVTGKIGAGYLGLHDHSEETIHHYECPEPRIKTGLALREVATACMDISDGLVQDLGHLCHASNVGAEIDLKQIPLADPSYDPIAQITGGDDYELLFTAPTDLSLGGDVSITPIGTIKGDTIRWLDETGKEVTIEKGGWQHF